MATSRLSARARGFGHGNIGSLPKRFITFELIKKLFQEIEDPSAENQKKPKAQRLIRKRLDIMLEALADMACRGDLQAIKLVFDRVEGLAVQTMQFKMSEVKDGEETPDQLAALALTQEKILQMTPDERIALYRSQITEASRTAGSA